MKPYKVAIVEDEIDLLDTLVTGLADEETEIHGYRTYEDFIYHFDKVQPHLILTDYNLPGQNGRELVRKVRELSSEVTIFMYTGDAHQERVIDSFKVGADDFISKPFDLDVLSAKIKRALQKSSITQSISLTSELTLNERTHEAMIGSRSILLTSSEFSILKKLNDSVSDLVPRSDLEGLLQGSSLDVHISSLRKKIKDSPLEIKTFKGKGYRLSKKTS